MSQDKNERIFISYKRVDKERVFAIKGEIENATREKCWIDLDGIESDAQFANVIIKAINQCEVFIFMYSKEHANIVEYDTDWTIREISFAQKKHKRIVFVNIDKTPLTDWFEMFFGTKQQIDATDLSKLNRLYKDMCLWLNVDACQTRRVTLKKRKANEFWQYNKNKLCFLLIAFALVAMGVILTITWRPMTEKQIHDSYDSALMMLYSTYHFEVDCGTLDVSILPDPDDWSSNLVSKCVVEWTDEGSILLKSYDGSNSMGTIGSGTFIGEEGNILTNIHIARPWLQEVSITEGTKSIISVVEDYYIEKLNQLIQTSGATSLDPYIPKLKVRGVLDGCYATFNGNYFDLGNSYSCTEVVVSEEQDYGLAIMRTICNYIPTEYIPLEDVLDRAKVNDVLKYGATIYVSGLPDQKYQNLTFPYQTYFVEGNNLKCINGTSNSFLEISVPMMFDVEAGGPVLDSYGRMVGVVSEICHDDDASAIFKITHSDEILRLINQANISK